MILVIIYNGNCIAKIAKNIFLTYQIWNADSSKAEHGDTDWAPAVGLAGGDDRGFFIV